MKPSDATCSWHTHDESDPTDAAICGHSSNTFNANHDVISGINPIRFTESEKTTTFESNLMGTTALEMQSTQIPKSAMSCFSGSECIDIDFLYQVRWQCDI
jgi:hypothetical protein